jgi:hypothetical protein
LQVDKICTTSSNGKTSPDVQGGGGGGGDDDDDDDNNNDCVIQVDIFSIIIN